MGRGGKTAFRIVQLHKLTTNPRRSSTTFPVKSRTERKSEHSQEEVEFGEAKRSRRISRPLDREVLTVGVSEEEEEVTEAVEDHTVDKVEASRDEAAGMVGDSVVKAATVRIWGSHSRMGLCCRRYDTERAIQKDDTCGWNIQPAWRLLAQV